MAKKSEMPEILLRLAGMAVVSVGLIGATELLNNSVFAPPSAPTPANENGVITAEEWGEVYPEIYASYLENNDNTYRVDYLEQDPYLTTLYEGFGFAKDYTSAIGHTYTLEDVYNTERPHALANCLTCKTPDFTKLVNDMGVDAYTLDFTETYENMNESVSCYNCHENLAGNDGQLAVTHSYVTQALGEDSNISLLADLGDLFSWIFYPLGWMGDMSWKATVATVTGLIAKEEVVMTFGTLYNFAGELSEAGDEIWKYIAADFGSVTAYSFMIFQLLCAPCFAAMGAIKREMGSGKWTAITIAYMCAFAYAISLIVYQLGGLITGEATFSVFTVMAVAVLAGLMYLIFRKGASVTSEGKKQSDKVSL